MVAHAAYLASYLVEGGSDVGELALQIVGEGVDFVVLGQVAHALSLRDVAR
jgi:hypothetical protein